MAMFIDWMDQILLRAIKGEHRAKSKCPPKSTAERLVDQIYSWIDKGERCARNLEELATELESLREKCNVVEATSNSAAALGSVMILVSPFTGPAAPLVGMVGLGVSLSGTAVTITSKVTEHFCSSSKLEKIKQIDKDCRKMGEKIKELFEELKSESGSKDKDQQLEHAISEFLKAFAKQKRLDNAEHFDIIDDFVTSLIQGSQVLLGGLCLTLMSDICLIFSFFGLNVGGKILAVGGGKVAMDLAIAGGKAVLKESLMFLGGVVGLAMSLPDAIKNWKDLIENNNETEATRKIREAANAILESIKKLTNTMNKAEETLTQVLKAHASARSRTRRTQAEAVEKLCSSLRDINKGAIAQRQRAAQSAAAPPGGGPGGDGPQKPQKESSEEESSSSSSEDETGQKKHKKKNRRSQQQVLQMGLLNARSVCTPSVRRNNLLRDLISDRNLDILVLTETWLEPGQQGDDELRNLLPRNRHFIQLARGGRGGGVAIVFSEELQFRQIELQRVDSFEYVAAVVQHRSWEHPVVIISVYHTTASNREGLEYFLFELEQLLFHVYEKYPRVLVAGDFNIWVDQAGWQRDVFNTFLRNSGLEQFVNQATHRHGHILDLVIGRFVTILDLFVQDDLISDHWTVYFELRPFTKKEIEKKNDKSKKK